MLYAEENTYIKQQVAHKDPGANGKEFVEMHGLDEYDKSRLFNATWSPKNTLNTKQYALCVFH